MDIEEEMGEFLLRENMLYIEPVNDEGIILDVWNGRYYRVGRQHMDLMKAIAVDDWRSSGLNAEHGVKVGQDLVRAGLLDKVLLTATKPRPSLQIRYVLWYWTYSVFVGVFGWRFVRSMIKSDLASGNSEQLRREIPLLVHEIVLAGRRACALPFVSSMCIPSSLTIRRLLMRHGLECKLVVGAVPRPFLPHMWVEWEGRRIDIDGYRAELDGFRSFSRI